MAGENEAYSSVYKGQEGTGDAFIVQGADDPIKAYALAQKENEALKLKAQHDIAQFCNYIVGGYTKHHDMLAKDQLKIAEDYKNLLVKHNGNVPATDMVDLNTRKSQLQGLAKVSDKMTDYVKTQTLKYQSLGPDKQQGWDKVQDFINETDPKKQLDAFIGGNVPLVTEKPKIYDWRGDATSDKTMPYTEYSRETDEGSNLVTRSGKSLDATKAKAFASDYAASGLDAQRNPEAAALLAETKVELDKDPKYKSIIDPVAQQQYMLGKARDKFVALQSSVADSKYGKALQEKREPKEDKAAWKQGDGYMTNGKINLSHSVDHNVFNKTIPGTNTPNNFYSVGYTNEGDNKPLIFENISGKSIISAEDGRHVTVDTKLNDKSKIGAQIKSDQFTPLGYLNLGKQGVFVKARAPKETGYSDAGDPFEVPSGIYYIPLKDAEPSMMRGGFPSYEKTKSLLGTAKETTPQSVTGKSSHSSGTGATPSSTGLKTPQELGSATKGFFGIK